MQEVSRLLQQNTGIKGAAYALRKILFLLSFASALTAEELQALSGCVRIYGETFVIANEEARAKTTTARVLIQEINQ